MKDESVDKEVPTGAMGTGTGQEQLREPNSDKGTGPESGVHPEIRE